MTVPVKITVRQAHKLDQYARLGTDAIVEAARVFASRSIPRHFAQGAEIEYGYEARDPDYTGRKVRAFGHARPLEFTGETRRRAMRPTIRRLGHTKRSVGGALISIDVPQYISDDPRRRREIEATSSRDEALLTREVDRRLTEKLRGTAPEKEV